MKANTSIQLKAVFLLIVFSLNTVIGFACSIRMDLGFNAHHHKESAQSTVHAHADGKKHHHHHKSKYQDRANNPNEYKSNEGKDNCCNYKVTKFAQLEKVIPQSVKADLNPVFFTILVSSFYNVDFLSASQAVSNIKYFARSYHPPIPNIRIAIQSFQI